MTQLNVTRQGPEAMLDNPSRTGTADYTSAAREFRPTQRHLDWRVIGVCVAGGLVAFLILYGVYSLWKLAYCWGGAHYVACERLDIVEPVLWVLLLVLPPCFLAWSYGSGVQTKRRQEQVYANRTNLTLDRWGDQFPADFFEGLTPHEKLMFIRERTLANIALKAQTAPFEIYWGVNSLSEGRERAPAALLPAPVEVPATLVPSDTWLPWLDESPHLLISGPTGAGKTTLATALLASTHNADLLILDPHDAAGKWPVVAIGGGRDYDGIYAAIDSLMREMSTRFEALKAGETIFPRLIVLLDEAPAVALHDLKRWQGLVSRLTSEARKVEMRFIVLAQSHLVQDIGLSSLVRRNLGLVALGPQAIDLVKTENDRTRQQQLLTLVRGQKRPAAYAYASQTEVLDVSVVPSIAQQPILLRPWSFTQPVGDPVELPPDIVTAAPRTQVAWLAANTHLTTREIRSHVGCDYTMVVEVTGKVRGPRGTALRARLRRVK